MMPERELRCFVDCTETICSGINTGIQRTVRNIIGRHAPISKTHGMQVIPVVALNGRFYRYDVEADRKIFAPVLSKVFGAVRNLLDRICYGKKMNVDAVAPSLPAAKVPEQEAPQAEGLHLRIVESCRKILPFFFRCAFYLDHAFESLSEADIQPDDVVFYPDAFWYRSTYLSFPRYQAVKILLVHDIIPLTMPKACDPLYVSSFQRTLSCVLANVDGVMSISRSELANIRSYLSESGAGHISLFDYNYWGADFAPAPPEQAGVGAGMAKLFTRPCFIMVGTLEPRKNHSFVLDAFERFWSQGGEASLCIIGTVSLHCSELKGRIDRHEMLGRQLFCLQGIDDSQLAYCYQRCAGVVFASLAEGFGLPLVEAMWYGRPVLASDIAVFREIGGDYPRYFQPDDPDDLIEGLFASLVPSAEAPLPRQWISWDSSVDTLFGKVANMARAARVQRMQA